MPGLGWDGATQAQGNPGFHLPQLPALSHGTRGTDQQCPPCLPWEKRKPKEPLMLGKIEGGRRRKQQRVRWG